MKCEQSEKLILIYQTRIRLYLISYAHILLLPRVWILMIDVLFSQVLEGC